MEIDTRFPTVQPGPTGDARAAAAATVPLAAADGQAAESDFYISPVLRFDSRSLTVIFQVRDSGSGDVVRQFPPEAVVERYRQDPTAKPFVLSPRLAAGADAADPEADDLAPFPEPAAGRGEDEAGAPTGRDRPAGGSASGDPVDLVA